MMNGIAGVLPQGSQGPQQAPGQAAPPGQGRPPMPGMKPPMGGAPAGVPSLTPALAQMGKQQLLMEMMNPNSRIPKYALLSAIDQKAKQEQAMQAVQGAMAQQQAQQQQQSGTVAQEVLQAAMQPQGAMQAPPVMARHGGAMHSYNRGGIVGYQSGGATSYPVEEQEDITTLPLNERIRRTLARLRRDAQGTDERAVNERLREALPDVSLPALRRVRDESPRQWQQAAQGEEPDLMGETLIPVTEPDIGQAPNVAMLGKTGDPDVDIGPAQLRAAPPPAATQRPPAVQLPPAPQAPRPAATTTDPMLEARLKELAARGQVPPEVQEGRSGIAALVEQEMKARQQRMEEDRAEAMRRRDMKRAPGIMDPEGLLQIAAAIRPEKGQVLGSLARGAAGVMGAERAAKQGAEKEYQDFMRLQRAEENAMSQMRLLEAQRLQALREGDVGKAQQVQDAIYATRMEAEKIREARQDKQREFEIAEERNSIAREGVDVQRISATRPGAEIQLMEWLRSPDNKKLYDSIQSAKRAEERLLKLRELYDKRPLTAGDMSFEDFIIEFERATGKTSSTAGGPPPGAVRLKGQQ